LKNLQRKKYSSTATTTATTTATPISWNRKHGSFKQHAPIFEVYQKALKQQEQQQQQQQQQQSIKEEKMMAKGAQKL